MTMLIPVAVDAAAWIPNDGVGCCCCHRRGGVVVLSFLWSVVRLVGNELSKSRRVRKELRWKTQERRKQGR
jgi:hypothetical protein